MKWRGIAVLLMSRISLVGFIICLILGFILENVKKPNKHLTLGFTIKKTNILLYIFTFFFIEFIVCSFLIHPLIGAINSLLILNLIIILRSDPEKISAASVFSLYGSSWILGVTFIISIVESIIGRALF